MSANDPLHLPPPMQGMRPDELQHECDMADMLNDLREVCEVSGAPVVGYTRSVEQIERSRADIAAGMAMLRHAYGSPSRVPVEPGRVRDIATGQPDGAPSFLPERLATKAALLARLKQVEGMLREEV